MVIRMHCPRCGKTISVPYHGGYIDTRCRPCWKETKFSAMWITAVKMKKPWWWRFKRIQDIDVASNIDVVNGQKSCSCVTTHGYYTEGVTD
jgi:hypothetical protein